MKIKINKLPNWLNWISTACYVFSTVLMISPTMASKSILPWCAGIVANIIFTLDSISKESKPWIALGVFFIVWQTVILITRKYPHLLTLLGF